MSSMRSRLAARVLALALVLAVPKLLAAQSLSPADAVRIAAKQSPSLRAALADLGAAQSSVRAERAARGPTLVASASGQRAENLVATGQGVSRTEGRSLGADAAVRYTTEIGTELEAGGSGNVSWRSANITPSTSTTLSLGPNPAAAVHVQARQPLLRGAGRDAVLAALRQAQAGQSEAERTRDETASALVRDVLVAYWELWYAARAVEVQSTARELAAVQHREAEQRVQLGIAPPTDVLRFASELASIGDGLTQARTAERTRSLELGRLLAFGPEHPPVLSPDASPPDQEPPPALAVLLREARESCSELRALAERVQGSREQLRAAVDADQARLDLTTTLSAAGLWAEDDLAGLALPDDRPALTALLGLELELPLGDSKAAEARAGARYGLLAAQQRYRVRAQAIDAEVARLRTELEAGLERLELTREVTQAAARLAEAERQRLRLGTATSTDVVQAQQSAREAELRGLRARVDQVEAALQLDHLTGVLLLRHAAALAEAPP